MDRFRRAMTQLSQPQVNVAPSSAHKQVASKRAVRAGSPGPVMLSPAARRRRVLTVLGALQLIGMVASAVGAGVLLTVRRELAAKVFAHTSDYDSAIARYLPVEENGLPSWFRRSNG